jgi:hypothetical protein
MTRQTDSPRAAFWRELIERRRRSGLSVAEICEQAGVSAPSFYQWQRKLHGRRVVVHRGRPGRRPASRLVPVRIVAGPPPGREEAGGRLEVELPGEIRLRIPAGCDQGTLELVLNLLRNAGGQRESG